MVLLQTLLSVAVGAVEAVLSSVWEAPVVRVWMVQVLLDMALGVVVGLVIMLAGQVLKGLLSSPGINTEAPTATDIPCLLWGSGYANSPFLYWYQCQ